MRFYLENLLFTANIIVPIFLIVFLGVFLKRRGVINQNFVTISSKLVFTVTLPALVFMETAEMDFERALNVQEIIYVYAATLVSFALIWIAAAWFIKDGKDRGVFIQGSFRSNFGIIGLAIAANVFGAQGLAEAAVLLAFVIPLYNVLSVFALTIPLQQDHSLNGKDLLLEIIKNPLILALIFALPFAYFHIAVPPVFRKTGEYLATVTLPLALIGIGGSLNFISMRQSSLLALLSTAIKIVLSPLLLTYGAYLLGFSGRELVMLFILFACPTAVASFIMAEAMGGNGKLAGNIVVLTTVGSLITISAGIFILKVAGLF